MTKKEEHEECCNLMKKIHQKLVSAEEKLKKMLEEIKKEREKKE